MLKCQCPECGAKAELENSASEHQFACECGKIYRIPPAPPAGDFRICLNCSKLNEYDAGICTGCSFNFVNNKKHAHKVKTTEISPGKGYKAVKTVFLLLLLAVAGGLGYWIYSAVTASPIGVSDDAPLGTFKEGKDFNYAVFKPVSMKLPPKWKDYKGYQFVRKNKTPLGDAFDHVFLLADARGRIAVIKGHYTETVVPSTPAEKTFFERIRKEYGMPEAEDLKRIGEDGGMFKPTKYEEKWENGRIRYIHNRIGNPGTFGLKAVGTIFVTLKDNPGNSGRSFGHARRTPEIIFFFSGLHFHGGRIKLLQ